MGTSEPAHFLSLSEFSRLTGLSPSTIRRRVRDGSIRALQPGGRRTRLLFTVSALDSAKNSFGAIVSAPSPSGVSQITSRVSRRPQWMDE